MLQVLRRRKRGMAKTSPQRRQMRSGLRNINTNKTGACLGWVQSSASSSCLLFICPFAAIVTFLLLQLRPQRRFPTHTHTHRIHSTGAERCCPPDVSVLVHPQGHFHFETYMFILKCWGFFSPPSTDPCQCLCCTAAVVVTLGYHL